MLKYNIVGVDSGEGPPVPIPNTEVKLTCAENTWLEAAREDRKSPTQRLPDGKTSGNRYSSIAQSVEHLTVNQGVTGSSPVGGAKKPLYESKEVFSLISVPRGNG